MAFNKTVQDLEKIKLLKDLEAQTGVKVPYLAGGAAAFVVLFTYFVFGPGLLCNLIGFFYPVYASIKAVETDNKEDDTRWLIYWIIYAFFNIIETFGASIIFSMRGFHFSHTHESPSFRSTHVVRFFLP